MSKNITIFSILDKYSDQQGWDTNSKLDVALSFIADNCNPEEFEASLKEQTEEENGEGCEHCRSHLTESAQAQMDCSTCEDNS